MNLRFFKSRTSVSPRFEVLIKSLPRSYRKAARAAARRPVDISEVRDLCRRPLRTSSSRVHDVIESVSASSDSNARNLLLGIIRALVKEKPEKGIQLFETYRESLDLMQDSRFITSHVKLLSSRGRYSETMQLLENLDEDWSRVMQHEVAFRLAFTKDPVIASDSERILEYISKLKELDPDMDEGKVRRHLFSLLKEVQPESAISHGLLVERSDARFHKVVVRVMRDCNQTVQVEELIKEVAEASADSWFINQRRLLESLSGLSKDLQDVIINPRTEVKEEHLRFLIDKEMETSPSEDALLLILDKVYWKYRKIKIGAEACEPVWNHLLENHRLDQSTHLRIAEMMMHHGRLSEAKRIIEETELNCDDHDPEDSVRIRRLASINGMLDLLGGDMPSPKPLIEAIPRSDGKVLYLLHNSLPYNSGGYATRTHGLLTGIKHNGWDIHGVSRYGYPWDRPEFRDREVILNDDIDGITYHRLQASGDGYTHVPIRDYLRSYADSLVESCRKLEPSIIHGASNYMNGFAAVQAARAVGIPSVYEVRGLWEITRISRQPEWEDSEFYRYMSHMETWACRNADAVITITDALKEELMERGVDEEKILVVHNGVHPDRFIPRGADEELKRKLCIDDEVVIGYIGSMVSYEGLELLVDACGILEKQGIKGFRFLMVGDGAVHKDIMELVSDRGFEDYFIFTGRVPHEEVESYYTLVDIAPFPRYSLPVTEMVSPLKPFEAMAMEKCVIASNVQALEEIILDGETGLLFKKDDAQSLAEVLEIAIMNPDLRRKLGSTARRWVTENRDWKVLSSRVSTLYHSLLADFSIGPSFKRCIADSLDAFKTEHPRSRLIRYLNKKEWANALVRSKGYNAPKVLFKESRIEDVQFDTLPDEFVLKPRDGASNNGVFILERNEDGFHDHLRHRQFSVLDLVNEYNSDLGRFDSMRAPVMIEEKVNDADSEFRIPLDYKMYCFNGKVVAIMQKDINRGQNPEKWRYRYIDRDWNDLGEVYQGVSYDHCLPKPQFAQEMVEVAEELSGWIPMPFVRVDMYSSDAGPVFGEFTFHPGTYGRYTPEFNHLLGSEYQEAMSSMDEELDYDQWIRENKV